MSKEAHAAAMRNLITEPGGASVDRGFMTACTADACHQGDKPCPCPDACRLPVSFAGDEPETYWVGLFVAVIVWTGFAIALVELLQHFKR